MNQLGAGDLDLLAARARGCHVVHCPNCHAYFGRPPFPFEDYRKIGLPVSLGTDSCASNRGLNLFSEMQTFRANFPAAAPAEILDMVTRHPAAALGWRGRLGVLAAGACADLIALPYSGSLGDVHDAVVENRAAPLAVIINGQSA
jgi:cytosine/adenosine deaminase-related metal-dependent hydrolase